MRGDENGKKKILVLSKRAEGERVDGRTLPIRRGA